MLDYRDQDARNQTVFREMNEWTSEANQAPATRGRPRYLYLCECSDRHCTEPISLSSAEYEGIRGEATRFAIAHNHENPEIDRVVVETEHFTTVEKFYGSPAQIARDTDPRR